MEGQGFYIVLGIAVVAGFVLGFGAGMLNRKQRKPASVPGAPPPPPPPPRPTAEPLRLLGLLQREGRLLDFLLEDIQCFNDQQVGAAVREIHRKCAKVIQDHLELEPVRSETEGEQVTVPAKFDPSAIRVTGNVTGQPPYAGTLAHRGWRVRSLKLTPSPPGQDEFVLMPAEVEVG